jgi:outer membrane protein OmpA-like peptidoglycan-associated protein
MPQPDHAWPIAQVQEPGRLRFVVCSACPERTPKTLPGQLEHTPPGVASAMRAPEPTPARFAPVPEPAHVTAPADRRFVATVNFALNSSKLRPGAAQQIEALLPVLVFATDVEVTGYTDDLGSQALNERLALARARTVVRAIGASDRYEGDAPLPAPRGRSLCCYVSENRSEAQRALNRRAEVVIRIPSDPQALRSAAAAASAAGLRELGAAERGQRAPGAAGKP